MFGEVGDLHVPIPQLQEVNSETVTPVIPLSGPRDRAADLPRSKTGPGGTAMSTMQLELDILPLL